MVERTTRETNEATYIRGHWVGGQRFRLPTGKAGWYVITWSNSKPIAGYWVAEGKFYKAWTLWVKSRTFDVEILREVIEVETERRTVTLEAIRKWEAEEQDGVSKQTASSDSGFQLMFG